MGSRTVPLAPEYRAEFDAVSRGTWHNLLAQFADANLYQTWDYDAVRCGERNLSHLVLKCGEEVVALAQARLVRIPALGWGAAYVRWGPLWRRRGRPDDPKAFCMALRALRNQYAGRRGLFLRVFPLAFATNSGSPTEVPAAEQFVPAPNETPQQTILMNIEAPLADLRKGFHQKWRNCLNHAERNSLVVRQGNDDLLFADFIPLYKQLVTRKQFVEPNNIFEFKRIQQCLPNPFKMCIFLCNENGALTGGAICSAMGDTGLYLFGATNELGLKNKGAYLLQWHALQWLKDQGCKYYNLNGINPVKNAGSYHFKAGLGAKSGHELPYLGRFDSCVGFGAASFVRVAQLTLPRLKGFLHPVQDLSRLVWRREAAGPRG